MNWPQPDVNKLSPVSDEPEQKKDEKPFFEPLLSGVLRCQMPMLATMDSDQLRQYYQVGMPQYRISPPSQIRKLRNS